MSSKTLPLLEAMERPYTNVAKTDAQAEDVGAKKKSLEKKPTC